MADAIERPVIYVNTGQFGGTGVYHPDIEDSGNESLQKECSEGLVEWKITIEEIPEK